MDYLISQSFSAWGTNNHRLKTSHATGCAMVSLPMTPSFEQILSGLSRNRTKHYKTLTCVKKNSIELIQKSRSIGTLMFDQNLKYNMHIRRNTHGPMMVMRASGRNSVRNKNSLENSWILLLCLLSWYAADDTWKNAKKTQIIYRHCSRLLLPLKPCRSTV